MTDVVLPFRNEAPARSRAAGLRVRLLPELRDVDTAQDAYAVAALCPPHGRFAPAVRRRVPA
jgi:hypothetical protein